MTTNPSNPLVAPRVEGPKDKLAGVWLAEDLDLIAQGIRNGSWIDGTLGVVGAGLDALALVTDPVGTLLQYGISWLLEHVKPLSEALDWLAGDPAQIAAHAHTWRNMAQALHGSTGELTRAANTDLADWHGTAAAAYRAWSAEQRAAVEGLAQAAELMSAVAEAAGALIAAVRVMVRDAIATVVSRLAVYAAELIGSLGAATPLVVEQVTALCASWAARIARWLKALISSLRRLVPILRRTGEIVETITNLLRRFKANTGPSRSAPVLFNRSGPRGNMDILENGGGIPMTPETVAEVARRAGVDLSDVDVHLVNEADEARYLDFWDACAVTPPERLGNEIRLGPASFADEETLAATLAHERVHVDQLRSGTEVSTGNIDDLEAAAYAAEGPALERMRGALP